MHDPLRISDIKDFHLTFVQTIKHWDRHFNIWILLIGKDTDLQYLLWSVEDIQLMVHVGTQIPESSGNLWACLRKAEWMHSAQDVNYPYSSSKHDYHQKGYV